jgi:2-dehydro-3-deoxyglucarate aldolase
MDAGAYGVIVPQVNSVKEALQAVHAVKYPPEGTRGVGLARAQGYGTDFDQYKAWNSTESIVIPQIENIRAVDTIDQILAVDNIDAFIVGPYDLSASLGVPGQFNHPAFLKAMKKIQHAIDKNAHVSPGFHVVLPEPNLVKEKVREGYTFLAYSLDSLFLAETCRGGLRQILGEEYHPKQLIKRGT